MTTTMTTANSMASQARDKNDTIKRDTMTKAIKIETKNMIRKLRSVENATLKQTFRYCWSLISIFSAFGHNFVVGRLIVSFLFFWQSDTHKHADQAVVRTLSCESNQECFRLHICPPVMRADIKPFFKCKAENAKLCSTIDSNWIQFEIYSPFSLAALSIQSMRCLYK